MTYNDYYLMHHGIPGQKWGLRRYQNNDGSLTVAGKARYYKIRRLDNKNDHLAYKIETKEKKAAVIEKKAEKIHAKYDLGESNRAAKKSADYKIKAAKIRKKALGVEDDYKRLRLEAKAAKKQFKSDKLKAKSDRLSKLAGYSDKAMRLLIRSDKVKAKADKARLLIANNKKIQAYLQKSISEISKESEKAELNWDRIPKNTSYTDFFKIYNHTDPKTVKDQELKELMKMEYDEFKNSKK